MERKGPERERVRERAQEMEAKIEARGSQAAMKDSAIQDTPKLRRANESW